MVQGVPKLSLDERIRWLICELLSSAITFDWYVATHHCGRPWATWKLMEPRLNCCGIPALPKNVEFDHFQILFFQLYSPAGCFPVSKIKFTPRYWLTNPLCLHPRIGIFFILAPSWIRLLQRMYGFATRRWPHHCFQQVTQGEPDADVSIWDKGVVWHITWGQL